MKEDDSTSKSTKQGKEPKYKGDQGSGSQITCRCGKLKHTKNNHPS